MGRLGGGFGGGRCGEEAQALAWTGGWLGPRSGAGRGEARRSRGAAAWAGSGGGRPSTGRAWRSSAEEGLGPGGSGEP
ncbi:hypothetical protein E2562_025862 [Oryza meyeriana var. granulata]|uniref:Uncharacterized protein n=1 Tax=Oryza meyeriana var. granulata TaxID=110450 RepID=A0A6G1BZZ3_9ORYZ|nr:hypothetical protein E2562_025862 [Oryza meyeriana var. granulata]